MLAAQAGLADSWLDDALKSLTDEQRKTAADNARERAERLEFGIGP